MSELVKKIIGWTAGTVVGTTLISGCVYFKYVNDVEDHTGLLKWDAREAYTDHQRYNQLKPAVFDAADVNNNGTLQPSELSDLITTVYGTDFDTTRGLPSFNELNLSALEFAAQKYSLQID